MKLYDFQDFLLLSAVLNLHWGSGPAGIDNVLGVILGDPERTLPDAERRVLRAVLVYLDGAYGRRRRRLGPLAVLHPLRATALLARAMHPRPPLLDLLSELLHDKLEDVRSEGRDKRDWDTLEESFGALLKQIDPADEWLLMERIDRLTRRDHETYYQYVGRLLDHSQRTPELVRVKLADRLDNCLDLRITLQDPIGDADFFGEIFQILFVRGCRGYRPPSPHPAPSVLNGAERLYQLFKNAVLMSLIRQKQAEPDEVAHFLFECLARASMREAERIILHVLGYHLRDASKARRLLLDTMDYIHQGGLERVTDPGGHRLDGLLKSTFDHSVPAVRREMLAVLYEDKELMLETAVAFLVVFLSFLEVPEYYLAGITEFGISTVPPRPLAKAGK